MIRLLFESMRPLQWTKNLLVFAALFFSQSLDKYHAIAVSILAFLVFCAASSTVYIINDLIDAKEDRRHPLKKNRPIASRRLKLPAAMLLLTALMLFSVGCGFFIGTEFGFAVLVYFALQVAYSSYLKHRVIFDVFGVALGYVVRAVAGGEALKVAISPWLIICTFLLALFIILGKRRTELTLYDSAVRHRPILGEYTPRFLDQMISIATSATLVAYGIYTLSERTINEFGTSNLVYTMPFVAYGLFRYLYIIYKKSKGDYPEKIILADTPLLINTVLYALSVILIIYVFR